MTLRITYAGSLRGKRLFAVSDGRERLFMGTLAEVKRFIVVRAEKLNQREQVETAFLAQMRNAS